MRENDEDIELGRKAFQLSPWASRHGHILIKKAKKIIKMTVPEEHYAKVIPLGEKILNKIKTDYHHLRKLFTDLKSKKKQLLLEQKELFKCI